jgi:hypothetical protein
VCTDQANSEPPGCAAPRVDGVPEVEIFDRTGAGAWVRLPHFGQGSVYSIENPERYADTNTGQVLLRFVNEQQESYFQFNIAISGEVS